MKIEDTINLTFGVIMLFLTILGSAKIKGFYIHLLVEILAIVIILIASRSKIEIIRNWYSLILVPTYFMNLRGLVEAINPVCYDRFLFEIDKHIFFGRNPFEIVDKLQSPILSEVLQICYTLYFFVPVIAGISLYNRDRKAFRLGLTTILVTFYLSYLGYFLVPAVGPRFVLNNSNPKKQEVLASKIKEILDKLEPTKFDCFPSGHTAVSLACLYIVRKHKKTFLLLLPITLGIILATIYHKYHWMTDVIAGVTLFMISVPISNILFRLGKNE
ncbi:MAG: phosphatase PAP2 family protein [Thermosulfidibacteraceae bacterium]